MHRLNRRRALGIALAMPAVVAAGRAYAADTLSVTIDYMAQRFEYREDQGVDIGSFTSDIGGGPAFYCGPRTMVPRKAVESI